MGNTRVEYDDISTVGSVAMHALRKGNIGRAIAILQAGLDNPKVCGPNVAVEDHPLIGKELTFAPLWEGVRHYSSDEPRTPDTILAAGERVTILSVFDRWNGTSRKHNPLVYVRGEHGGATHVTAGELVG